jgi:predicted nucleotidyltransferase
LVDKSIVESVRKYLLTLDGKGFPISFGVVFGSYATGSADKWSDIDLLVVSSKFDGPSERVDIDELWRTAARTDSRIEPIPCGERQWLEDDSSHIIEIARREGELIRVDRS